MNLSQVLHRPLLDARQIAILWSALLLTTISLFFSLYAVWSPVAAPIIGGIQGRYFLGLTPLRDVRPFADHGSAGLRQGSEAGRLLPGFVHGSQYLCVDLQPVLLAAQRRPPPGLMAAGSWSPGTRQPAIAHRGARTHPCATSADLETPGRQR